MATRAYYIIMAIMILVLASNLLANLALGQSDGHESTVIITARPGYSPPADDGPGSGPGCPEGEVVTYERASITGLVFQGFTVRSPDRRFSLFLDEGIVVLTPDGQCPQCIGIHEMTPPPPPEGAQFVGAVYNAIPDLTAFTPPATIIYSYDPADIPDGFSAESLVIALRDPATEEWMKLDGVLDTQAHTITARIGRFNDLAVLCYEPQEPEPTALTPTLTPAPTLTSTPTLTPTPTPTLPPTPLAATPGSTTNWWLIGGIAAAAAAVAAVAIFLFRRRF